jgi:hypothetical protein
MNALLDWFIAHINQHRDRFEEGAVGALVIGIVIGVALVIFGIIKFLIPGD